MTNKYKAHAVLCVSENGDAFFVKWTEYAETWMKEKQKEYDVCEDLDFSMTESGLYFANYFDFEGCGTFNIIETILKL